MTNSKLCHILEIPGSCCSQYIVFTAAHHPHCYSCSCSSENGTSELDSFTSTDEKQAKGVHEAQMEECANNTHLIHLTTQFTKTKMNVTNRTVRKTGLLIIGHINGRTKGNLHKLQSQIAEYATNSCFTPVSHLFALMPLADLHHFSICTFPFSV